MTTKLRVGVIGSGNMAALMVRTMRMHPEFEPVGALSGDAVRSAAFCKMHGFSMVGADLNSFVAMPDLDVIYVANANGGHAAAAKAALAHGKAVLVEKPLTLSGTETSALFDFAKAQNVLLVENLWQLCLPAYRSVRATSGANGIGKDGVLFFDFSLPADFPATHQIFDVAQGGVLRDRAVYGFAAATDLFGPATISHCDIDRNAAGLDVSAIVHLHHARGARSIITVSFDRLGSNDIRLTSGNTHIALGDGLAAEFVKSRHVTPSGAAGPDDGKGSLKQRLKGLPVMRRIKGKLSQSARAFHPFGASGYFGVLDEFAGCVRAGKQQSDILTADLSCAVANLVDQAQKQTA